MKAFLFIFSITLVSEMSLMAQSIKTIKDPNGNEIIISKDSSFVTVHGSYIYQYAIDIMKDERNVLVTNGDTSFWLLSSGFPKDVKYSPFLHRYPEELVFGFDGIWYITQGLPGSTTLFYNSHNAANAYEYLNLYEFSAVDIDGYNFLIEARKKATGDTIDLYYNTELLTTTPYNNRLKIIQSNLPDFGPYEGSFFIGSVFDNVNQVWSEVGLYREFNYGHTLLLPLGVKQHYEINKVGGSQIVDHFDNGTKRVYQYSSSLDSCIEVTPTLFPNFDVLDYQSLKWTTFGYPLEPPLSYNDFFWKGRDTGGDVKYFREGSLGEMLEITDLRNASEADFIHSDYTTDSIYYYNYSNAQKGFTRTHIYNGGNKKDPSSVPFDHEFKLKGYLSNIYFGRYNPASGKIEAARKDLLASGTYSFLQSSNGKRIENPIDFTFLDDKVFVYSRSGEGLKLVAYDPNGIVGLKPVLLSSKAVLISPNPSKGVFNITLNDASLLGGNFDFFVTDEKGVIIMNKNINDQSFVIDLSNKPAGKYTFCITAESNLLYSTSLLSIY
jgi:hypothetical protein